MYLQINPLHVLANGPQTQKLKKTKEKKAILDSSIKLLSATRLLICYAFLVYNAIIVLDTKTKRG